MSDYKMVISEEFIGAVRRGAFDHWQGEVVPVRGPDRQIVGEATIVNVDHRDDGTVAVEVFSEIDLDYEGLARITETLVGRESMSFSSVDPKPDMPTIGARLGNQDIRLPHQPRRDDDVARWLKAKRDEQQNSCGNELPYYWAIDELLDEYRARADYGLTLDAPLSELPDGY